MKTRVLTLALLLSSGLLLAMKGEPFRYSRPIEVAPGWAVLDLPDDVLDQARQDLSDLRIVSSDAELPWGVEPRPHARTQSIPLIDVERTPGRETRAVIDRGDRRQLASELTVDVAGNEPFLKPVMLEASDDRKKYREIARGSLFRVSGASMTSLRFAPNDRRFWRIRLDDRESAAVEPRAGLVQEPSSGPEPRSLAVALERLETTSSTDDSYALQLPTRHQALLSLTLGSREQVFSRSVSVYERVVFRDQPSRRLIGSGRITRGPGGESLAVALGATSGTRLEIDVEHAGSRLDLDRASLQVTPRRIVFFTPARQALQLRYGSQSAVPPHYDVQAVLSHLILPRFQRAALGAAADSGAAPPPLAQPARGPSLEEADWPGRATVLLPKEGRVAYLDLNGAIGQGVRLVDAQHRQVPYVTESGVQFQNRPLSFVPQEVGTRSVLSTESFDPREKIAVVTLEASQPEYFSRRVSVFESPTNDRGETQRRDLGVGTWERAPGQPATPFDLVIDAPTASRLQIEIENGDNPALTLSRLAVKTQQRRIDFLFEPGEQLTLWYGNPRAGEPSYDLGLLAPTLIASPAQAARLELKAQPPVQEPKPGTPRWLWAAVVAAAGLVAWALVRALRSEATPD